MPQGSTGPSILLDVLHRNKMADINMVVPLAIEAGKIKRERATAKVKWDLEERKHQLNVDKLVQTVSEAQLKRQAKQAEIELEGENKLTEGRIEGLEFQAEKIKETGGDPSALYRQINRASGLEAETGATIPANIEELARWRDIPRPLTEGQKMALKQKNALELQAAKPKTATQQISEIKLGITKKLNTGIPLTEGEKQIFKIKDDSWDDAGKLLSNNIDFQMLLQADPGAAMDVIKGLANQIDIAKGQGDREGEGGRGKPEPDFEVQDIFENAKTDPAGWPKRRLLLPKEVGDAIDRLLEADQKKKEAALKAVKLKEDTEKVEEVRFTPKQEQVKQDLIRLKQVREGIIPDKLSGKALAKQRREQRLRERRGKATIIEDIKKNIKIISDEEAHKILRKRYPGIAIKSTEKQKEIVLKPEHQFRLEKEPSKRKKSFIDSLMNLKKVPKKKEPTPSELIREPIGPRPKKSIREKATFSPAARKALGISEAEATTVPDTLKGARPLMEVLPKLKSKTTATPKDNLAILIGNLVVNFYKMDDVFKPQDAYVQVLQAHGRRIADFFGKEIGFDIQDFLSSGYNPKIYTNKRVREARAQGLR